MRCSTALPTCSTTMNYQNVLIVALAESRKLVAYASGVVLLSSGQPDELYICIGAGISANDQTPRISAGRATGAGAVLVRSFVWSPISARS